MSSKDNKMFSLEDLELIKSYLIGNARPGQLIGEVSMTFIEEKSKNKRLYSCICTSPFAICIILNQKVFDILVKEKLKKNSEMLAMFIYKSIPGVK